MSIKSAVAELEAIRSELKNLGLRRKALKEREKIIEHEIASYLKSKEQPGVKHQGMAIVLEEKEVASHKKAKDRDADAILVLERYNIPDAQKVLAELLDARKGDLKITEKLKVKKIKSNTN